MLDFYQTMKKYHLNEFKAWTISNNRKEPINPQTGLKYHFDPTKYRPDRAYRQVGYWGDLAHDPDHTLVTLDDLFSEPNIPQHDFSLRVNTKTQHIILVDVEHVYDHDFNQYLRKMPFVYGEKSRHGGFHFIVAVADELYQQYQTLFNRTSIKVADTPADHSGVEFFFKNHYLTFTENQINVSSSLHNTDLATVLDYLSNKAPKTSSESVAQYVQGKQLEAPGDALVVARHAMSPYHFDKLYEFADLYNDPDFTGDDKHLLPDHSQSYRDYRIVLQIAVYLMNNMHQKYGENPLAIDGDNAWLSSPDQPYNPEILAWTVFEISKRYLKPRPKLTGHMIHNQTYQQYLANSAVTYLIAHNDTYKRDIIKHGFELPAGVEAPKDDDKSVPLESVINNDPELVDFENLVESSKEPASDATVKSSDPSDSADFSDSLDFDDYQNQTFLDRFS